jgi:signal transduction histidine kinase
MFRPDGSFMPHEQCPMAQVVSGKIPGVHDAEVLIERPDGSRITVVVNIRPLRTERGEVTGAINCFYDITERKQAEQESLKQSREHQSRLLKQSRQMQNQLRLLSHQLLSAQEEERKRISRELHDVIAQTLTSITLRLEALKNEAVLNTKGLERSIERTQQLVEHSVNIVHRFARELRPAALDDLGLIPALHAFMKAFKEETGIHISLSAFAEVEQVNADKREVLYRAAQEALTNIARHAQADRAKVTIQKLDNSVCMKIQDNGKGFRPERVLHAKNIKRLGLLGMKERVQMVRGTFTVQSALGKGTTVRLEIPLAKKRGSRVLSAIPRS